MEAQILEFPVQRMRPARKLLEESIASAIFEAFADIPGYAGERIALTGEQAEVTLCFDKGAYDMLSCELVAPSAERLTFNNKELDLDLYPRIWLQKQGAQGRAERLLAIWRVAVEITWRTVLVSGTSEELLDERPC